MLEEIQISLDFETYLNTTRIRVSITLTPDTYIKYSVHVRFVNVKDQLNSALLTASNRMNEFY